MNILRTKRALNRKQEACLIIFKGLPVTKTCLRPRKCSGVALTNALMQEEIKKQKYGIYIKYEIWNRECLILFIMFSMFILSSIAVSPKYKTFCKTIFSFYLFGRMITFKQLKLKNRRNHTKIVLILVSLVAFNSK